MEKERNKQESTSPRVSSSGGNSRTGDTQEVLTEIPNIRLSPEQIEQIHVDEYTLKLFYATRVEALSLADIKTQFPEPEPKKALSVMERFTNVGLVHVTQDGKYYSNYPENYINYSDYRYDRDLEARKDNKVFNLMKEFTRNEDYWKDRSYFSMDAFYTKEQTEELRELFVEIKRKAKRYANENAKKKSIRGLFFRRLKFYDMMFSFLLCFLGTLCFQTTASAGGNDPTVMRVGFYESQIDQAMEPFFMGGGNDPTARSSRFVQSAPSTDPNGPNGCGGHDPSCTEPLVGGGGHDPGSKRLQEPVCCVIGKNGEELPVYSEALCKAHRLLIELIICEQSKKENCEFIEEELIRILSRMNRLE